MVCAKCLQGEAIIMKLSINRVEILFVIFIYIYMPSIFPHPALIWTCFFGIMCVIQMPSILRLLTDNIVIKWFQAAGILLFAFVSSLHFYGFGGSLSVLSGKILMLAYIPMGVAYIILLIIKNDYKRKDIWLLLIHVAMIQAFLDLLAYVFKPIQDCCCFFLQNVMSIEDITWWREYRLYGLSASMTFAMPVTQALLGGLCFLYASKYNAKYYWAVPIIWVSGIINARVALIVVLIEVIAWIVNRFYEPHDMKIRRSLLLVYLLVALAIGGLIIFSTSGLFVISSRLTDPFVELVSMINGKNTAKTHGYFSYFFASEGLFSVPRGFNLIFGGGILNNKADVGYIMQLWMGGIVSCVLIYFYYLRLLREWYSSEKNKLGKRIIVWTFGFVLFIVNIKGDAFVSIGEFTNLFFLATGIAVYYKNYEDGIREI